VTSVASSSARVRRRSTADSCWPRKKSVTPTPQQLSFPVETLADLREFYAQIVERKCSIDHVSNHGNAIGAPSGTRRTTAWRCTGTSIDWPQLFSEPIDLSPFEEELIKVLEEMRAAALSAHRGEDLVKEETLVESVGFVGHLSDRIEGSLELPLLVPTGWPSRCRTSR
jgi:hypothetical protein